MNPLAKYLPAVGCLLVALGCVRVNAGEPLGFIAGNLTIISLNEVDPGATDEKSPAMARKVEVRRYDQYPLLIVSKDGKKKIVVTADPAGHYRLALPPGDYILDAKGRAPGRVRAKQIPFTVVSNRTVEVDIDIDTGIR